MTSAYRITVPDPAVVVLVGPAGCGKSTFARNHFAPGEVLSSDAFRELVSGDPGDQSATPAAFGLLRHALDERMKRRRLTVIDATSLTFRERARYLDVARAHGIPCIAVAFDLPLGLCQQLATGRSDRIVPADVVAKQHATFHRHLPGLADEPFDEVVVLSSMEEIDAAEVSRRPAPRRGTVVDESSLPPAVVIDLDGTLTSAGWREHFLTGPRKDWGGSSPVCGGTRRSLLGPPQDPAVG